MRVYGLSGIPDPHWLEEPEFLPDETQISGIQGSVRLSIKDR